MRIFNKKDRRTEGLNIIRSHKGKKKVYNEYLKLNPEIAEKYLEFISRNKNAVYIVWDRKRKRFVF